MHPERDFISKLRKSFRVLVGDTLFSYKIFDMPHFPGSQFRFDAPKPFDLFGVYSGIPFAVEAKFAREFAPFSIKKLRDSQLQGLEDFSRAGGQSFVFLNVNPGRNRTLGVMGTNRIYVFPWAEIRDGRKITREALTLRPHLARIPHPTEKGEKVYDVNPFLLKLELKVY